MTQPYTLYNDLIKEVDIPKDGSLSRTIHEDAQIKVIMFGFDTGQELSEHTASMPATLHFLQGDTKLTLGEDEMEVGVGAWVYMEANLAHSVYAKTPVIMLLQLLKA